jgi:hypothetical protein
MLILLTGSVAISNPFVEMKMGAIKHTLPDKTMIRTIHSKCSPT